MTLTLTDDQQNALDRFVQFLMDPSEQVFVLEGYSGTGKSTLVKTLLDNLDDYIKTVKLINANAFDYEVQLTATTNKAAETFATITGMEVRTIHSFLGLRPDKDYKTGASTLIARSKIQMEGYLLFIDEASMIDSQMLTLIFQQTKNCKIVFIGDRAQLLQVKANVAPVFHAKFPGAMLSKVVRQAEGNPITTLATQFRETVNTGVWQSFVPDGHSVIHLPRDAFDKEIVREFTRPEWRFSHSKILAWRNECVIRYNQGISEMISGDPHFNVGDYAVCNSFVVDGKMSLKTDQMVLITDIEPEIEKYGVAGNMITLGHVSRFFFPSSLAAKQAAMKHAKAIDSYAMMREISEQWIDLRAIFAQTVNKSQGSTYDEVFIDLDDISRCNNGDLLARMMYVAVSRARTRVWLTGDFA